MKLLKNIFFSILVTVFFFAAVEFSARGIYLITKGPEKFREDWLRWAEVSGWHKPHPPHINSFGLHNSEISGVKKPDTFRILVMGGSAVYGKEPIESSWTWNLQQLLEKQGGKKYEVLNGGIPGGTSHEEMVTLHHLVQLKPDLIVVYDGWNDIYGSHFVPEGYRKRAPSRQDIGKIRFRHAMFDNSFFLAWFNHATGGKKITMRTIKKWFKKKFSKEPAPAEAEPELEKGERKALPDQKPAETGATSAAVQQTKKTVFVWDVAYEYETDLTRPVEDHFSELYKNNLLIMKQLADKKKIPIIFFLQPNLAYNASKYTLSPEADKTLKDATGILYEDWIRASKVLYRIAIGVFSELKGQNILAYDFSGIFDGRDAESFSDSVHQPDRSPANDVLAARVRDTLLENKLI